MTKLALIAFTLTAIVAYSAVISAYRTTIITTTTTIDNRRGSEDDQCRTQIPIQQLNHCEMHLNEGIRSGGMIQKQKQQHLKQCCAQLKQVSERCQCDAIQQVFDASRRQVGVIKMREMLNKAQRLPNDCSLEMDECPLVSPRV